MKFYINLTKKIGSIIPKKIKTEKIYPKMRFAGINQDYDFYVGSRIIFVIILFIIGFILPITLLKTLGMTDFSGNTIITIAEYSFTLPWLLTSIILGLLFLILPTIIYYMRLLYIIQMRSRMVEDVLPDFLFLVANNISAGMTTFSAVSNSTRKEFGILSDEIKIALSKSMGSESFTDALKELNYRIDSQMLTETISFFSEAMKSGGKLAKLLENTATDLRQRQELKKELKSSTKMYVMFVLFIILIATPLLLSISVQFLHTIENLQGDSTQSSIENTQVSFLGGKLLISPEFMKIIAYILLFVNSILASLFMGLLMESKVTQGVRYFPLLFFVSTILFTLGTIILPRFLGTIA